MPANLVKSPFTINKDATGATWLSADLVSVATWTDVLSYAVPLGTAIEVTPQNYHYGDYNATDTTTTITAGRTRLLKQNANGTNTRELWLGPNSIFGDISDVRRRPSVRVPVILNASQVLKVQIISAGTTLDSASSDYFVECQQVYEEI